MSYVVLFNCANALVKMPKRRRDWQEQLRDDFIRGIHGRRYHCETRDDMMARLKYIANGSGLSWLDEENHVKLDSTRYAERILPAKMYGFAQGYVDLDKRVEPLERGAKSVFIRFSDFYDARQGRQFRGCYIEVISC